MKYSLMPPKRIHVSLSLQRHELGPQRATLNSLGAHGTAAHSHDLRVIFLVPKKSDLNYREIEVEGSVV